MVPVSMLRMVFYMCVRLLGQNSCESLGYYGMLSCDECADLRSRLARVNAEVPVWDCVVVCVTLMVPSLPRTTGIVCEPQ